MTDKLFARGIRNAVSICMNVQPNDRVLVISDQKTGQIGGALAEESAAVGAASQLVLLEDLGSRPMTEVPAALTDQISGLVPTVTFFAADSQEGEVKMRLALTAKIRALFTALDQPIPRHGHMVGVTSQLIREGMTADYHKINQLTLKVLDLVKDAREIKVRSKKGSEITASFSPELRWVPCHGLYHQPGDWGNLPEGEVFTCPWELNGTLVVDVLGDYFSPKYGVLDAPVVIEVEDSQVVKASCQDQALADEFLAYLDSSENGRRAGEFAIGTNTAVHSLSGNLLQDEKIPGIHVAFGNPIAYQTGADWQSDVHVDVVPTDCTITVDGKTIMYQGTFIPGIL